MDIFYKDYEYKMIVYRIGGTIYSLIVWRFNDFFLNYVIKY